MALHHIRTEQLLPISLEEAWDFFSSPRNLDRITPEDMKMTITNNPSDKMFAGQIITYKIKPFPFVHLNWVTEITHVRDSDYFIDEQRFGPYAFWHHKHSFEETDKGVLMVDDLYYKMPFGFIGTIAHELAIRKKVKNIFSFRYKTLEKYFTK
ncbi:MAG: SRPBCC family protein [Bacteroidia bacterium]|nr:SRPBCC family protein [Bacteroidia bacterium]NNJ56067.1 SRPBCC family protein [Bacteroidia bacterium]